MATGVTGSVVIRKYRSDREFSADAAQMGAAGFRVAAQSSGGAMTSAGQWVAALGIVLAVGGWLFWLPLILVGVVLTIIGAALRTTTYTVTYEAPR